MVTANTIALTIFFIVPTSVVVSFPLQTSSVVGVIPALGDFKEIGGRARRPGNCAGSSTVSTRSRDLVGRWVRPLLVAFWRTYHLHPATTSGGRSGARLKWMTLRRVWRDLLTEIETHGQMVH